MSRAENRSRAEEEEAPHESLHCFRKNAQYDAPPARVELAKWVVVAHQRIQREVHCSICLAGFAPLLGFSLLCLIPDFFGPPRRSAIDGCTAASDASHSRRVGLFRLARILYASGTLVYQARAAPGTLWGHHVPRRYNPACSDGAKPCSSRTT